MSNDRKIKPQAEIPQRRRRGGPGGRGGGHGPMGAMLSGEKPKDFKAALRKLLHYLGSFKIVIIAVMVIAVASTVFSIVGPKILGNATTELFEGIMGQIAGTGTGPDFDAIGTLLLTVLGLYVVSAIFQFFQGFIMANVSNQVSYRLRRDIDIKIMRLPFQYYDKVAT